jgi:hypothetical protein
VVIGSACRCRTFQAPSSGLKWNCSTTRSNSSAAAIWRSPPSLARPTFRRNLANILRYSPRCLERRVSGNSVTAENTDSRKSGCRAKAFSEVQCVPCRERPYVTPRATLIAMNITVNAPHSTSTHPMERSDRLRWALSRSSPSTTAPKPKAMAPIPQFPDSIA